MENTYLFRLTPGLLWKTVRILDFETLLGLYKRPEIVEILSDYDFRGLLESKITLDVLEMAVAKYQHIPLNRKNTESWEDYVEPFYDNMEEVRWARPVRDSRSEAKFFHSLKPESLLRIYHM